MLDAVCTTSTTGVNRITSLSWEILESGSCTLNLSTFLVWKEWMNTKRTKIFTLRTRKSVSLQYVIFCLAKMFLPFFLFFHTCKLFYLVLNLPRNVSVFIQELKKRNIIQPLICSLTIGLKGMKLKQEWIYPCIQYMYQKRLLS